MMMTHVQKWLHLLREQYDKIRCLQCLSAIWDAEKIFLEPEARRRVNATLPNIITLYLMFSFYNII